VQQLQFANMSKSYAGVPALQDVTLDLQAGRVHALMGENGAGKSTLIKLVAGVVQADNAKITCDGEPVTLRTAADAHQAGYRIIHQELNVVPPVSVAENILIGRTLPRRFGFLVNWKMTRKLARDALAFLGANHIDVRAAASELSAGDKMLMKIASAFVTEDGVEPVLFILDEPTAALSGQEAEMLFVVIERLKKRGAAILYVSHRLDEVLSICDDVTVLRDGVHVSTMPVNETSKSDIIQDMTGRAVKDSYPARKTRETTNATVQLNEVNTAHLQDINFSLNAGEVLGIAGLEHAGQEHLMRLFLGLEQCKSGRALFDNKPLPASPPQAWSAGIAHIPRERRTQGLMLDMPIRSNIVLPHLKRYGVRASSRQETVHTVAMADRVKLKYNGPEQQVGTLSGGNQQKVVFARALFGNPKLLLLEDPTRGVDVGAKWDIYELVRELTANGCTVILASTDLPELLGMCDRILILQDGRQTHLLDRGTLTPAELVAHYYTAEPVAA